MSLILTKKMRVWWNVDFSIPADERHRKITVKMLFAVPYGKETDAVFLDLAKESEGVTDYDETAEIIAKHLSKIVLDWKGIKDEEGNDVPFSEDAIKECVKCIPMFTETVGLGFREMLRGGFDKSIAAKKLLPPSVRR